jgi:hypothetical protein
MTWEEINGVIPHTFGGIILQSTYCPSLGVRSSILADRAFRQDVLGLLSDDHAFASHLRESTSAPGAQPQSPTA